MKYIQKHLFLIFILALTNARAQKELLDSLKKAYTVEKSDAKKTVILTEICYKYIYKPESPTNYDSLNKYFDLITKKYNSNFNIGDSTLLYGEITLGKSDSLGEKHIYLRSISFYKRSIAYHLKSNDYAKLGIAYLQIALNKQAMDLSITAKNASEIFFYYNQALSAFEKADDKKNILGIYLILQPSYQTLGNTYFADLYLDKAYKLSQLISDDYEKAYVLTLYANNKAHKALNTKNVDIITINTKLSENSKKQLEATISLLKTALQLYQKTKSPPGEMFAMNMLAYYYAYLQKKDSALHYGYAFLKCAKKDKDSKVGLASAYGTCGDVYHSFKDYDKALKYMDSCYLLASEIGKVFYIKELAVNYAKIYSIKKEFEKAFKYQQIYIHLNDSMSATDLKNSTAELQTKYETEKKEGQITSLNQENKIKEAENKRQRLFTVSSICVGVIILFFTFFIFRSLQANKRKNIIIAQQKLIVEEQKHLVEEKHQEITDSINYAQRIQRSLLAGKKMLDENFSDYFILFKPKDVVSGDFYWAKTLSNNNFAMVTADSTGHGVPGAIMSMLNIACLNEVTTRGINSPDQILFETRKRVIENLKNDGSAEGGKDGMDCSLLSFDFKNNTLLCACANNPVWIIRQGELIEIKPDKMPVGKHDRDQLPFTLHTFQLQKNDTVYAITDGYIDQFGGEKNKKFMSKNLKELLLANVHLPIPEQKQLLDTTFVNWVGLNEQVDDVTVVGIRIS